MTNIDHDEIKAVLSEYKISNADVAIRQAGITADDLVDVIEGNRWVRVYRILWPTALTEMKGVYSGNLRTYPTKLKECGC